jgi:type IV pilus assembly protein PilA
MKKQGFTLIELMVVIVIMGILAAVAVPKLFGMIAKSKASEVPTAAGTWINMQDAYFQEKNDVGNWLQIGYSAPGTKDNTYSYHSNVFGYSGSDTEGVGDWVAVPSVDLNECTAGTADAWKAEATLNGTAGSASNFQISVTGDAKCTALTASWSSLSRASGN